MAYKNITSRDPRKPFIVEYLKAKFGASKVTLLKYDGVSFSARILSEFGDHTYISDYDGQISSYRGFGHTEDVIVPLEDILAQYPATGGLFEENL